MKFMNGLTKATIVIREFKNYVKKFHLEVAMFTFQSVFLLQFLFVCLFNVCFVFRRSAVLCCQFM